MSRFEICLAVSFLVCAPSARAAALDVDVKDTSGQPVADAAVYAMPAGAPLETKTGRAEIVQVDREFVPYVTVVQTGTTVTFPNRDPILHHVYSFSQAKPFEIKLYSGKSPEEIHFDKPGFVTVGCNIHDWMIGYVAVVSTPYFGKTDAAGQVRLRDLPAGSYELRVWHPQQRAPAAAQPQALAASAAQRVSFALDVAPRKPRYKPPLDRARY